MKLTAQQRNRLIVFSGIDGAGKSTQIELLVEYFRMRGVESRCLWTRGGYTPAFNALKTLLRLLSRGRLVPPSGQSRQRTQAFRQPLKRRLWLILALLDLLWIYGLWIRWWHWRGHMVICDRYYWDTLIDFRLQFPRENVENWLLWRLLLTVAPRPSVAFLFLVSVDESMRRSDIKGEPYREDRELLTRRLAEYENMATIVHWLVLDGCAPVEDLAGMVRQALNSDISTLQYSPDAH